MPIPIFPKVLLPSQTIGAMQCALCNQGEASELSHIAPKFVFDWMKRTAPSPFLRSSENPNLRIQDGPKQRLLCGRCEDAFSLWESDFARHVFHPAHQSPETFLNFEYSTWFLKFAVSVSWRSLTFLKLQHQGQQLPHGHDQYMEEALSRWRDFLLGTAEHPAKFEQHFLLLGLIDGMLGVPNGSELNYYALRGFDHSTVHNPDEGCVITKMGRVVICGTLVNKSPGIWKGTKIRLNRGQYSVGCFSVSSCFTTFIESGVEKLVADRAKLSPIQKEKIDSRPIITGLQSHCSMPLRREPSSDLT